MNQERTNRVYDFCVKALDEIEGGQKEWSGVDICDMVLDILNGRA